MKITYLVSIVALMLTVGCNNQPVEEKIVEKEVVEKETVKVVEAEAPAKKVVVEEEKGTSIQIGSDGGSIKTKKVDIKVGN